LKINFTFLAIVFVSMCSYGQGKLSVADTTVKNSKPVSALAKDLQKSNTEALRLQHKVDSLQEKGLPTSKYQKRLDSINSGLQNQISLQLTREKISSLKSELNEPRDSVQKEIDRKESALKKKIRKKTSSLDSLNAKTKDPLGQVNLPSSNGQTQNLPNQTLQNINLPTGLPNTGINVPGGNNELSKLNKDLAQPQSQEVKQLENEVKKIETVPKRELNSTDIAKETNEIKKDAKEIGTLEKQTAGYKKDIKGIKEGDSAKMASLDKDVEKAAANTSAVKGINSEEKIVQTQKNALQQYQDILANVQKGNLKDAEKLSMKEIKNPFIGQESKLQTGVTQLDKLKKKYHTIPDSRYLPKHVPNEMKGKPLKERLVPGFGFQWYQGTKIGVDLSPYLMYRLSGKLRVGVGASDRFVIDNKKWDATSGHVQALRAMADFRLNPMLNLHAEEEWTHYGNGSQNTYRTASDPRLKEWNVKLNVGILKTYKISRRFDGQIQLLYNTLDWTNFPQTKNTSMRFGFEYKLGVKKRGSGSK